MKINYHQNEFNVVKKVTWSDLIDKINYDSILGPDNYKVCFDDVNMPSIFTFSNYRPNSINDAFIEVQNKYPVINMHVYSSFAKNGSNYGKHFDNTDVLIVQAVGSIKYGFDDDIEYQLNPGDSVFIPAGINHTPIVIEPRITLSFDFG